MTTLTAVYRGSLRTEATHTRSGNSLITDAPIDNNGKGEAFSPTDLVCTALCTCMLTTMGIWADQEGVNLDGMTAAAIKVMGSNPRKIAEIQVILSQPDLIATEDQRNKLKDIALHCPVALSLHDSVIQTVTFEF